MGYEEVDTVPMEPIEDDGIVLGEHKVPEPALVRAAVVAVANLVGVLIGREFLSTDVIEQIVNVYVVLGPLALGWWIRRNVTPVGKHRK